VKERHRNLLLLGTLLAAVVAAVALAVPGSPVQKEPILGLDLQGGLEVVLEARPERGAELTEEDLNRSAEIIRDRIDKLGVREPEVRELGENQIGVALAGVFDRERAIGIVGQTARLELYDLQKNLVAGASKDAQEFPVARTSISELLSTVQARARQGEPSAYYLVKDTGQGEDRESRLVVGPMETREELLSSRYVRRNGERGKVPKGHRLLMVPGNMKVLTCGTAQDYCPGVDAVPSQTYYYLFNYDPRNEENPVPEMTGEDLEGDGTDFDFDRGQPIVLMSFTDSGADKFHDVTQELAERGRAKATQFGWSGAEKDQANQQFAIVLDGEIKSAPTVDFDENPGGIPGNNGAQITGLGSVQEARDLALVLQTGALPVNLRIVDQTNVSATLGKDSLRQALIAAGAGLVLVAIFLLVFYRFLGLVAVVGLGLYVVFMYATILLFDVTLTLPGFAGMILAVGVAADANIVIFERIKEESASGKSVRAAISSGYSKGLATIVDANVVTAITALILFMIATGGVRGFAFLLLLGTAISILTAVFATRGLLGVLAGFSWFDNPKFMGASAQKIANWQKFDAVGKRRIWFTISGILIFLSIASIAIKGLNLGIDFKGGSQLSYAVTQPVQIEDVRRVWNRFGSANAQIQGRGETSANGGYREFQIKSRPLEQQELNRLNDALEQEVGAESRGTRNVSASFSQQILRNAIIAVLFSFFLITIYISFRFQWRFAVPIVRTIVNDGLIAVGIYSFSGREVTAATVAAFLTIIGYSIYDTIIIFDRVRENLPLMRRATVARIVNQSLWETVRRSLATTFITLLPVSALFFFGGDTLKDFAFAILIGISISAFSTIFIAAPFLAVLLERSPDYKHRKDVVEGVGKDDELVEEVEVVAEPTPVPEEVAAPVAQEDGKRAVPATTTTDTAARERRRQRRRAKPHGRPR
jgi:SecD/SecF fusion protein